MQNDPYLYFDINKQERDTAIRYLLGAILRSRLDSHFDHRVEEFDEDVNIYLAHLLFAIALPEYHELAEPYLSEESSDILRWVKATEDRTIRYFIFKVNADHLLVHLAIFDDLLGNSAGRKIFQRSEKHFSELAKLYYDQASHYHLRIYRRKTGVGEVLHKLSRYFDVYLELLRLIRRDYLHFITRFRDQAFDRFIHELSSYEEESVKREKIDHFLDLYSQWLKTKDPKMQQAVRRVLEEVRRIDPEFGKEILDSGGCDEPKSS